MEASAVAEVISGLRPYDYGWRSELPPDVGFFGHPIALELETRPCPEDDPVPPPSRGEVELAGLILARLASVLATAEREYSTYNADFPDVFAKIDRPRVWICREFQDRDGPDRWAFLVGISDAPDWNLFVEFRGLEFLEIWSGD